MPRPKRYKFESLTDYNYPEPSPGMEREIRAYKVSQKSRQHPQFVWLLKCESCGQYRDRDELYDHPYDNECLVCVTKRNGYWHHTIPASSESKEEKTYAPSSAKTQSQPQVRASDTAVMAEVRRQMHEASTAGNVKAWMLLNNELKKLQRSLPS